MFPGFRFNFGEVIDSEVQLNEMGTITFRCWQEIPKHFPNTETGALVFTPNHIHGII
jgi:putative transposase